MTNSGRMRKLRDRLFMRLSHRRDFDGLWIGAIDSRSQDEVLRRVGDALQVIKTYDQYRFRMALKEIERIWVILLPGHGAEFQSDTRHCIIDTRYVLSSPPEVIASAIVHEATHGRLDRHNIGYSEEIRHRVEKVCLRQELAFARKIPHGEELIEQIERQLEYRPEVWTDEALSERHHAGEIVMARDGGVPDWLIRLMIRLRDFRTKIARGLR